MSTTLISPASATSLRRACGLRLLPRFAHSFVALIAILVGMSLAGEAHAQEVQVPLDEEGRIQVVDARLAEFREMLAF